MDQIHENASKRCPLRDSKILQNHKKSISVPSSDLLSAPGCPWMSQMSIQGAKMIQKGMKNGPQNTHLDTISSMATWVGTGGRGGALRSAPTPQGFRACRWTCSFCGLLSGSCQVLKAQGGPPLPPTPPKTDIKIDQKSNQKKVQNFDPKWPPKGTLKISKI